MANWISSKLKVAENFFEQIDHQAAESLKKNERPPRSDELKKFDVPTKSPTSSAGGGAVSLKDQLKKKANESPTNHSGNDNNQVKTKPPTATSDTDWTELLSAPSRSPAPASPSRVNGVRGLRKDSGRRQGNSSGTNLAGLEANKKGNNKQKSHSSLNDGAVKPKKRLDITVGRNKLIRKPSDGEESSSSARSSSVELQSDGKVLDRQELELEHKDSEDVNPVGKQKNNGNEQNGGRFEYKDFPEEDLSLVGNKNLSPEKLPLMERVDSVSDEKKGVGDVYDRLRTSFKGKRRSAVSSRSSVSDDLKRGSSSSTSDEGSDSEGDSRSSSDSEDERERERRKKILAEKAAAKAVEAIKERENLVARLEGEKQSLKKILEERAKQQAKEASELQTSMMETMEAAELEKQKHNNTRMEALTRLAKLEAANADLARSLASIQKNLEVEINQVAELRQEFELKEMALEELRRRISKTHQTGTYLNQLAASKGVEFEREILEAEYSFITDKIGRLEDKAKELEADIETTTRDMEDSTEVEIELKRRLAQLTDHLIQKQAQVEALSAEKATIQFRIEAVSKLVDESKSMMDAKDLESGARDVRDSKLRPLFEDKICSGRKHLGSLLQQLDSIFVAGSAFLRRNQTAKLWSLVYLVCLHFWVIYILLSHSQPSNEGKSGASISLENINNTAGQ